jgi:2-hydroxy-3-keto-5-methylthiopentenyl-1-phosphate phosphatase
VRLVLDWDGTVTVHDSLVQVIHRFGDPELLQSLEPRVGHDLTLHEEIALEFEAVRAPLDEVVEWVVEHVRVRDGFHALAHRYRPTVISAGFHELIEPVLEREGVGVELLANRLDAGRGGWKVRWRDEAACATCREPCKRGALAGGGPYVYVGDGYSDRCAALAAERVFARDSLASYLSAQGVAFEPFDTLDDVAVALDVRDRAR